MSRILKNVFPVVLVCALAGSAVAHGSEEHKKTKVDESAAGHSHEMSEIHGGRVTMTPNHHFEVLFTANEARVYLYDKAQEPIEPSDETSATLVLQPRDGDEVSLPMKYVEPDAEKGRLRGYFAAAYDFSGVKDNSMKGVVRVTGLAAEPIEFKTNVVVSEAASYACPMSCVEPAADPMKCPKCGMDMVRKDASKKDEEHDHSGHEHSHDGHH